SYNREMCFHDHLTIGVMVAKSEVEEEAAAILRAAGAALPGAFFWKLAISVTLALRFCRGGSGRNVRSRTRINELPMPRLYKKSTSCCSPACSVMVCDCSRKNWLVVEEILPLPIMPTPLCWACLRIVSVN